MKNRIADYLPGSWSTLKPGGPMVSAAGDSFKRWTGSAREYIVNNPATSLAVAFATGVAIAWWLKRR
jgi:hypothetical protein